MVRKLMLSLVLLALLPGCQEQTDFITEIPGETDISPTAPTGTLAAPISVDHEALLTFTPDWNVLEGNPPIYAGGRLTVLYHPSRLPYCRATYNGMNTWSILLFYRSNGGAVRSVPLQLAGAMMRATFNVPEDSTQLELWFLNNDRAGCSNYDSRFGTNYVYPVSQLRQPAELTFRADWSQTVTGILQQSGLFRINYAPERLRICRQMTHGGRQWDILASWRFQPGGQTGSISLYGDNYFGGEAAIQQPTVAIPADATAVELWFANTGPGCSAWDSAFGENYRFPIEPPQGGPLRVGWVGDWDFVTFHRDPAQHAGDRDPAYYFDNMAGGEVVTWVEAQVWIPGLTDQRYASADAARQAAQRVRAEAITDALPPGADGEWGAVPLDFERQQGNNFLYSFRFWKLRYLIYRDPPIATGLYRYAFRVSTDQGATWFVAGREGDQSRRFVVAPERDCGLFPDNPPEGCVRNRAIGWAGNWGRIASHACTYSDGVPDPVTFYKSAVGHDCMTLTAEVWVPGLTDANGDANAIQAVVETDLGFGGGPGGPAQALPLAFQGRVGNNFRYAWNLGEQVGRSARGNYLFRFRFSADQGASWYTIGTGDGPSGGEYRTLLLRNDTNDIDPEDPQPDCHTVQRWNGATQVVQDCVADWPAQGADFPANHCEFYVNALGRGEFSHNGAWAHWLEAYLSIGPQQGELLTAGMWVRHGPEARPTETITLGTQLEPGYWLVGFTSGRGIPGGESFELEVREFAFFIDVRRPDGTLVRLWQSNGGANYSIDQCFAEPGHRMSTGVGSVEYAADASPIYQVKRACGH